MSERFRGFESLKQERRISLLGCCASAFAGWAALEAALAFYLFAIVRDPNASEIGLVGFFELFSIALTIGYLALFVVMAVPLRLLVAKAESAVVKMLLPLAAGAAFAVVSGAFVRLNSSAHNAYFVAAFFAFAGVACMSVLELVAK